MVLRVVDNNRNLVLPPGGVHSKLETNNQLISSN